jgi:hypothetical protein
MNDLFVQASREAFRYPSSRGELSTEQLWQLPLLGKGANSGFDLDSVARALHTTVREHTEASFVDTRPNQRRLEAETKLEVVKHIISVKQEERRAAEARVERADKRRVILDALAARETEELNRASREELLAKLAELDG